MTNSMSDARGSQWRRWDLHVHTPDTIINNQFGTWDEYLAVIEAHPDVKVIGVTDYSSITNYSKLKLFKAQGRISNIDLLIPNIEFRVAPPTDKATAVNIHILVSPDDPNHEQEILNALARLTWRYGDRQYSCTPDQIKALGYAFNEKTKDDSSALTIGTLQFKADFTTLRSWYQSEHWLLQNSLIAVSAGDDGLSGLRHNGGWVALRDEITRFAHILFSGRPGEREFWLGLGNDDDRQTVMKLGGARPCIHGSDAHEIAKLFLPVKDRFCWVKADTTFEGLKQVLYEPEDRVHIGPTPPLYHDEARIISAIKLTNTKGWFEETTIPLNAGLVSIIGQKGSGKSALAELIAYTAGSWHSDESGSFIKRSGNHLKGLIIELQWADNHKSTVELGGEPPNTCEVRYLSQRFVERLCAGDSIGVELVREIEAVIFSYIDATDTLNASNFDELRALCTEGIRAEGTHLQEDINRLISEECLLREANAKLPEKKARIKSLYEENNGLKKQLPKPSSKAEELIHKELNDKREKLAAIQQAIALDKQKLQKITDVRMRVTTFKSQIARFVTEIETLLKVADIPSDDFINFHPKFYTDTEAPLARKALDLKKSISIREGSEENPSEGTIRRFQQQIKALLDKDTADKARQQKISTIQTRIASIGTETNRIQAEISQLEGPSHERLKNAGADRLSAYLAYFQNLKREEETLVELYKPIRTRLVTDIITAQEQNLEFSIRWEANLAGWLERGSTLFDQRKTIPYGTMQGLTQAVEKIFKPAFASGDPIQINEALKTFQEEFRKPEFSGIEYLRSGVTLQDLLKWLYEVEHVYLSYGLKYNGVDLEKLSPGTKGIVLLILYLGMDVKDTRPLIVDQPDENLDNESIYKLLTAYFKSAKRRRQVILITHNPNLVVNGDSEQVIVATSSICANGLPNIKYQSGSLENTSVDENGIRERVCRILEGGSDAFLKREKRYDLSS